MQRRQSLSGSLVRGTGGVIDRPGRQPLNKHFRLQPHLRWKVINFVIYFNKKVINYITGLFVIVACLTPLDGVAIWLQFILILPKGSNIKAMFYCFVVKR